MNNAAQLPLALRPAPDRRFDTFVGSAEAVDLLGKIAQGAPGFILLSGSQGSGKTHLALATAQSASENDISAQYVPLGLLKGNAAAVLAGLEGLQLVLLDDVDKVLGETEDEVALFDFHNRARASGCAVLYTASAPPAALQVGLPDLRSRLGQCTQLILARPDDELRGAILGRKAEARGLVLDGSAISYLLRRAGRDMASLTLLLEQLDRASLAEQRRVTVPFIRAFLEQETQAG